MKFTGYYWSRVYCFRGWIAGLVLFGAITLAGAASRITLAWDAPTDPEVAGFKVYSGTNSRAYTSASDTGAQTSWTLSNLVAGVTYYFAATTYNAAGLESDFSEEINYTVESLAPARLMIANRNDGSFLVRVAGSAGENYHVEYTDDLDAGVWRSLGAGTTDASGSLEVIDAPPQGSGRRFYRASGPD